MKARIVGSGIALVTLLAAGCRTAANYMAPDAPRYAAPVPAAAAGGRGGDTLRVVTFNVEHGRRVDSAIVVLTAEPELRDADVVLLQEMDEPGTRRVAEALGMGFVYYPASRSLETDRDFGNAVLSRWPVVEDRKLLLPGIGAFGRRRRTATAVTLRVAGVPVRVYSVHLGTVVNTGPEMQRTQFRAVLADAARWERVVIGGDMNTSSVGASARARGYAWPTKDGPRTHRFGRWDHIFLKGFAPVSQAASGTVVDVRDASDHRPVWARGVLER